MEDILQNATSMEDLGTHYGDDIYESEIAYTQQNEFTKTCEDFLWRRSKCGLHICDGTLKNLQERFGQ